MDGAGSASAVPLLPVHTARQRTTAAAGRINAARGLEFGGASEHALLSASYVPGDLAAAMLPHVLVVLQGWLATVVAGPVSGIVLVIVAWVAYVPFVVASVAGKTYGLGYALVASFPLYLVPFAVVLRARRVGSLLLPPPRGRSHSHGVCGCSCDNGSDHLRNGPSPFGAHSGSDDADGEAPVPTAVTPPRLLLRLGLSSFLVAIVVSAIPAAAGWLSVDNLLADLSVLFSCALFTVMLPCYVAEVQLALLDLHCRVQWLRRRWQLQLGVTADSGGEATAAVSDDGAALRAASIPQLDLMRRDFSDVAAVFRARSSDLALMFAGLFGMCGTVMGAFMWELLFDTTPTVSDSSHLSAASYATYWAIAGCGSALQLALVLATLAIVNTQHRSLAKDVLRAEVGDPGLACVSGHVARHVASHGAGVSGSDGGDGGGRDGSSGPGATATGSESVALSSSADSAGRPGHAARCSAMLVLVRFVDECGSQLGVRVGGHYGLRVTHETNRRLVAFVCTYALAVVVKSTIQQRLHGG